MPHRFTVKAHEVAATKVVEVQMLLRNSAPVSPDMGVKLVLENGERLNWFAEDGTMPKVGDFVVTDNRLRTTFAATPELFAELFTEVQP